eukprot:6199746-Pleurochrysis_carterae.AAC.5
MRAFIRYVLFTVCCSTLRRGAEDQASAAGVQTVCDYHSREAGVDPNLLKAVLGSICCSLHIAA